MPCSLLFDFNKSDFSRTTRPDLQLLVDQCSVRRNRSRWEDRNQEDSHVSSRLPHPLQKHTCNICSSVASGVEGRIVVASCKKDSPRLSLPDHIISIRPLVSLASRSSKSSLPNTKPSIPNCKVKILFHSHSFSFQCFFSTQWLL